jgi:hypothetical protein
VLRRLDHRRHQRPFRIHQIRRMPQATPICRTPMLRRPRHYLPSRIIRRDQRIKSDSGDSIPFRMGS